MAGYPLSTLGFGPFFEQQLEPSQASAAPGASVPARVAAEHRGAYEVWAEHGVGMARISGRLRFEAERSDLSSEDSVGLPGVGDWVLLNQSPDEHSTSVIERVLSRRSVFTRAAAGRETRVQVIAANVDRVFAVCGLDADFNVRRIERYLARIGASGAQPAVILSKADLCPDVSAQLAEVEGRCAGVPVYVTSALRGEGVEAVRACIEEGQTAALVGSSGAGKSTLVNALLGEERMATGAVRESDGRGCHVTTHRQLVLLPHGGLLLDTPGMRELQLLDEDGLDGVFGDVAAIAERCRFRDCRHDTEPGCAVREAAESGALEADRLEHYRKLEREAQAYERRQDEKARRAYERAGSARYDEVARLRRWKGGKP